MDNRNFSPKPFYSRTPSFTASFVSLPGVGRSTSPPVGPDDHFSYVSKDVKGKGKVKYGPDGKQLIETLKVVMMNLKYNESIPPHYNTIVTHLLEDYHNMYSKYHIKEKEAEDAKDELEKKIKEWDILELGYKSDLKNLETILATKDHGMEDVIMARTNSVARRTRKTMRKTSSMTGIGVTTDDKRWSQSTRESQKLMPDYAQKRDSGVSDNLRQQVEVHINQRPKLRGYSTSSESNGESSTVVPKRVLPHGANRDGLNIPRIRSPLESHAHRAMAFLAWGKKKDNTRSLLRENQDSSESSESDDGEQAAMVGTNMDNVNMDKEFDQAQVGAPMAASTQFLGGRSLLPWGRKKSSSSSLPLLSEDVPVVPAVEHFTEVRLRPVSKSKPMSKTDKTPPVKRLHSDDLRASATHPRPLPAPSLLENIRPENKVSGDSAVLPRKRSTRADGRLDTASRGASELGAIQSEQAKTTLTRYHGSVKNTRRPSERHSARLPRKDSQNLMSESDTQTQAESRDGARKRRDSTSVHGPRKVSREGVELRDSAPHARKTSGEGREVTNSALAAAKRVSQEGHQRWR